MPSRPPARIDPGMRTALVILLLLSIVTFVLGAIGPFGPTMSFVMLTLGAVLAIAVAVLSKVAANREG